MSFFWNLEINTQKTYSFNFSFHFIIYDVI